MNAVSLYVATCRLILNANNDDSTSWTELTNLVPQLKKALSCTVCSQIVTDPMSPDERLCHHSICRDCLGRKLKGRPSCNWCRNHDKFVENKQVQILLLCYRKLCEYVIGASLYRKIEADVNPNANNSENNNSSVPDILFEFFGVKDIIHPSTPSLPNRTNGNTINNNTNNTNNNNNNNKIGVQSRDAESDDPNSNTNGDDIKSNKSSMYSVMFSNDHRTKIMIKRKLIDSPSSSDTNEPEAVPCDTDTSKRMRSYGALSKNKLLGRNKLSATKKGCRCGNATPTPGKLTCCGQRCPCYVDGKSCADCRCKGCRNPNKPSTKIQSKMKMEKVDTSTEADNKHLSAGSDVEIL